MNFLRNITNWFLWSHVRNTYPSLPSNVIMQRNISSEYDPTGAYNFSAWKDKLDDNVRSNYEKLHETLLYTDEKQNLDDTIETFEHIAKQLEQIGE